jgi:hypothetical protein
LNCCSWPNVAVAKVRGQFEKPEEEEFPPLEACTRVLVKKVTEYISVSLTVICNVDSRVVPQNVQ